MGILVLPTLIWLGIRFLAPQTYLLLTYDLRENRERAQFPETFDPADYTARLEACYNDNVPFRSSLISLEQKLNGTFEGVYDDCLRDRLSYLLYGRSSDTVMDISALVTEAAKEAGGHEGIAVSVREPTYTSYGCTEYRCKRCGEIYYGDFVGKLVDNSYFAPKVVGTGVLLGRFDWLFYAGEDSIFYYCGTNIMEQEEMAEHLDRMEHLQAVCREKGIELCFMIMPNKEQVYPEYMPTYEIEDSYKRADRFVDYVRENSDVPILYPIEELKEAELYWQTYNKYDSHWNNLGAFVGAQALYEVLGRPLTSPHQVEITEEPARVKDLLSTGGLDESAYPPDTDYFVDYRPDITVYSLDSSKADDIYRASSDSGNQKKLVMLGDSFQKVMSDYLARDFADILVAHRDRTDEVAEDIREADVLVLSAVERNDSEMFENIEKVIRILEEG